METSSHTCHCYGNGHPPAVPPQQNNWQQVPRKSARTLASVLLSIFIAFFPKCPMCWAVYMSMFGSLGIAKLPYLPWLLPVLIAFLLLHLFMQYRRIPQSGYLPFVCSLAGAICLLSGRYFFPAEKWLLITGMACIISGSLLSALRVRRLIFSQHTN